MMIFSRHVKRNKSCYVTYDVEHWASCGLGSLKKHLSLCIQYGGEDYIKRVIRLFFCAQFTMLILFPTHCLSHPSGVLIGWKNLDRSIACVVTIVPEKCAKDVPYHLGSVMGTWEMDEKGYPLSLRKHKEVHVPVVYPKCKELVVILYDQPLSSCYLSDELLNMGKSTTDQTGSNKHEKLLKLPRLEEWNCSSDIKKLLEYINKSRDAEQAIKSTITLEKPRKLNWPSWLSSLMFLAIVPKKITRLELPIKSIYRSRIFQYILTLPSTFQQFSLRFSQVKNLICGIKTNCSSNHGKTSLHTQKLHQKQRIVICTGNFLLGVMMDIFLGLVFVYFLTSSGRIKHFTVALQENSEQVVHLLSELLYWMTGVPAGLKLNTQLADFLRKFFLYHIYLWQNYLQAIQPHLQAFLWICVLLGCLGLTFLISLASDVFSVLTIHIYCFYVYAARLYSLQVYGMVSLARLFTGKKHNILHERIDSLPHDVDRLFAGTLIFTILFFLLPTTTLFYVVFTSLRLLVLLIKAILEELKYTCNKLPMFALILLIFKPSMLPGGIKLDLISVPQHTSSLYLKLHNKPLALTELFAWSLGEESNPDRGDTPGGWGILFTKLLKGHLIYPWIKRD